MTLDLNSSNDLGFLKKRQEKILKEKDILLEKIKKFQKSSNEIIGKISHSLTNMHQNLNCELFETNIMINPDNLNIIKEVNFYYLEINLYDSYVRIAPTSDFELNIFSKFNNGKEGFSISFNFNDKDNTFYTDKDLLTNEIFISALKYVLDYPDEEEEEEKNPQQKILEDYINGSIN